MPAKCKITVEVPAYLKAWINAHDVSQNALVVMGLRKLYKEEQLKLLNIKKLIIFSLWDFKILPKTL